MNLFLAALLLLNNSLHDVAIAMLLACSLILRTVVKQLEVSDLQAARSSLFRIYGVLSKIVIGSLLWISVSALPRILAFTGFELAKASINHHEYALIARHILSFMILLGGILHWNNLAKKVKKINSAL